MISYSTQRLLWCCGLMSVIAPLSLAQVTPASDDTVTVTSDPTTWIQPASADAVSIPAGSNGVVVNNGVGGEINGNPNGVVTSAQTTVNNAGNLTGVFNGVNFVNGLGSGILNNSASGTISSDSRAVNLGGPVQLTNAGAIFGTGDQRNGTVYSDSTANNFSVNNSGTIDAGEGNQGSGLALEIGEVTTAQITNSGLIQGRIDPAQVGGVSAASGASADGLRLANFTGAADRVFDGTIVNTDTGVISSESANGTVAGVRVANTIGFQGTLDNAGLIEGVNNGLYFGNPVNGLGGDHTGGVVNNTGNIESDSRALNLDGIGLTVNNSGNIRGTDNQRNGTVYADSTAQGFALNNQTGGVIDAGIGNDGAGFSAELSDTGNDFAISNDGQIIGRGNASAGSTTAGDGIRLERTRAAGLLDGTTTGLFTGTISNSGVITSEGANGTVGGFRAVNGVSFQGELNNDGVISGLQNGVYFGNPVGAGGGDHTGGVVNNTGVISSDSRALNLDGIGLTVNNNGTILGTGNQRNGTVYADSTAQGFTLNNSGTIDAGEGLQGAAFSAELADTGNDYTINNSGELIGRGNAGAGSPTAGDGIRLERTRVGGLLEGNTTGLFTGSINNTGTITSEGSNGTVAGFRAVNGVSFQGTLNNSGTIAGVQNGVYFGNPVGAGGSDHTGGVVNNTGVISSDSRAFNLDGVGLTVNNAGDILATGRQRNGTFYLDGTATGFSVNNLASGSIDARGGEGSGLSLQVGTSTTSVQTGSIVNSGLIAGSGEQTVDAGIRFFAPTAGATFTGDIVNNLGGLITGDTAPAVLVEDGVNFDGSLINAGTINGGISLASGAVDLEDTSILGLVIDSLLDFETADVNGTFDLAGVLELTFANLSNLEVGQTFDLLDFDSVTGSFAAINSGPVQLDISDLLVGGSVTVTAVPEPTSLVLLGLSGVMMISRRRRS